jgi:hypothetical protein
MYLKSDPLDETGNFTDEADERAKKRWDKILDDIILTFQIADKISNEHWFYQESKTYNKKLADQWRKITKKWNKDYYEFHGHVMTKQECKIYERGWKYFQKHFFALDD